MFSTCFLLSFNLNGQKINDSIEVELDFLAQVDTNQFNETIKKLESSADLTAKDKCLIIELDGNKYHNHGDDYTAKKLYAKSLDCAIESGNKRVEMRSRLKLVWLNLAIGLIEYPEGIIKANRILSDSRIEKDTAVMLMCYNALATFHNEIGKKDEAYQLFFEGLKLSENTSFHVDRATLLNNLGLHKSELGLEKEAIKDFKEGLRISENAKDIRLQVRLINNIAFSLNRDSTKRDSALYYFKKTLELGRVIEEPQLFIVSYTNLAVYSNFVEEFENGQAYYDSALAVIETNDMVGMRGKIYLGMAQAKRNQGRIQEALKLLNTGFEHVKNEKYPKLEDMVSYESFFSALYDQMGQHKKSLTHYKKWIGYRDSMRDMNNQKFLAELNLKYEDEKKLAEIEKQKSRADLAEKNQEVIQAASSLRLLRNTIILGSIILVILILFSIYYFRSLNMKKKMEQQYAANLINDIENERRRISSDLHDHIGLNLILVKNQLSENYENDKMVKDLNNIVNDVRKISRNIYPSQLNKLGIRKSLETMFDQIEQSTGIIVSYELEDLDKLDEDKSKELILYRVFQELSNNSIKHSQSKSIRLTAKVTPKKINLIYQDNGIGFDKSKILETSTGMGMRNVINRVEKIGGTINFESKKNQGVKVNINIERIEES